MAISSFGIACTYRTKPADSLADRIIEGAERLRRSSAQEITIDFWLAEQAPHEIVFAPDADLDTSALETAGISRESVSLLQQLHNRRKSGSGILAVLSNNDWSSVDYLTDHVAVPVLLVVKKQPVEVVHLQLVKQANRIIFRSAT